MFDATEYLDVHLNITLGAARSEGDLETGEDQMKRLEGKVAGGNGGENGIGDAAREQGEGKSARGGLSWGKAERVGGGGKKNWDGCVAERADVGKTAGSDK